MVMWPFSCLIKHTLCLCCEHVMTNVSVKWSCNIPHMSPLGHWGSHATANKHHYPSLLCVHFVFWLTNLLKTIFNLFIFKIPYMSPLGHRGSHATSNKHHYPSLMCVSLFSGQLTFSKSVIFKICTSTVASVSVSPHMSPLWINIIIHH